MGTYQPGQPYHLEVSLDKSSGQIAYDLSGANAPPTGDAMFLMEGPALDSDYSDIFSQRIPVHEGHHYNFGGLVKLLTGHSPFKIDVEWLDKQSNHLGYVGNFRPVADLNGWTEVRYQSAAPSRAVWARLLLGASGDDSLLFADPYFAEVANPQRNLVYNSGLTSGVVGWTVFSRHKDKPKRVTATALSIRSVASNTDLPVLLDALKLTLTASSESAEGSSTATLLNYSLSLPPDTAGAFPVDDPHATVLLGVLLLTVMALVAARALGWTQFLVRTMRRPRIGTVTRSLPVNYQRRALYLGALGIISFVVANAFLFGLGNSPFDMADQKTWSYIAVKYGPDQLYVLPTVVSQAQVWGGAPYHEAVFPYKAIMAYWFAFIGWAHRIFLNGPGPFVTNTFQVETLIKSLNLLFGVADGVLIYLILKAIRASRNASLVASALFIFNPAVWFSMSVFGANHVLSLFFVLLAILLAEHSHPTGAWLALCVAALTRPQMLVL
ncbi:MAG: hypothetical protein E6I11_17410, partial [Chloroflexi bacterium]